MLQKDRGNRWVRCSSAPHRFLAVLFISSFAELSTNLFSASPIARILSEQIGEVIDVQASVGRAPARPYVCYLDAMVLARASI